jgi:cell division septation protein DedD
MPNETPPGSKPGAAADASLKPQDPTTTPDPKTKSPTDAKPASSSPKTAPPQPTAVNKPVAGKPAANSSGAFYVQIAAVDARGGAETFARKVEALGFSVLVLDPLAGDKRTVYRVRIGPYEAKAEAEAARTKLADALKKKKADFFLVKG